MIGPVVDNQFVEFAQEGGRRRGRPRKSRGTKGKKTRGGKSTTRRRRRRGSRKH